MCGDMTSIVMLLGSNLPTLKCLISVVSGTFEPETNIRSERGHLQPSLNNILNEPVVKGDATVH